MNGVIANENIPTLVIREWIRMWVTITLAKYELLLLDEFEHIACFTSHLTIAQVTCTGNHFVRLQSVTFFILIDGLNILDSSLSLFYSVGLLCCPVVSSNG